MPQPDPPPTSAMTPLRWGQRQRLAFIEARLFWDGALQRADILAKFDVSMVQVSADLALYRKLAPGNLAYDPRRKHFVAAKAFQAIFIVPSPQVWLSEALAAADVAQDHPDFLPLASLPVPDRQIGLAPFRALVAATRAQQSLEILYHSMNPHRAGPIWRRITPHAFATDGLRWHVRAFCGIDRNFKDFLFSRIEQARDVAAPDAKPSDDTAWNSLFNVELVPNPGLTVSQRGMIERDYAMHDGQRSIQVRRALLYYFEKRLRLDLPPEPVAECPVIVANRQAFNAARDGTSL